MYEHGGIEGNGEAQEEAQKPNCLHRGPYQAIRIVSTGVVTWFCPACVKQVEAYHAQAGSAIERLNPAS